jgi:uncharacterized membrane protein
MLYTPESKTIPVNMSPELAIKAVVSAGMVSSSKDEHTGSSDVNLAEVIRKWKISKSVMKNGAIDPRD